MTDHCEEQEMEAEALTAIFDDCFEIISDTQPFKWSITLYPEQHSDGDDDNHVGIKVLVTVPLDYPEVSLPTIDIELLKGLVEEHSIKLKELANEEAEANLGLPSIFAICEKLREWLLENNVKGMDDVSMYAQMIRREQEAKKQTQKVQQQYESQKEEIIMTEAEAEELAVRKRRAEGTPCTLENFMKWKEQFEIEMKEKKEQERRDELNPDGKQISKKKLNKESNKIIDKTGRLTGFLQFSDKTGGVLNLEAMEEAAEHAQVDEEEEEEEAKAAAAAAAATEQQDDNDIDGAVIEDENLFDVDDEDLDDLDFDDDDDDEEPDI